MTRPGLAPADEILAAQGRQLRQKIRPCQQPVAVSGDSLLHGGDAILRERSGLKMGERIPERCWPTDVDGVSRNRVGALVQRPLGVSLFMVAPVVVGALTRAMRATGIRGVNRAKRGASPKGVDDQNGRA